MVNETKRVGSIEIQANTKAAVKDLGRLKKSVSDVGKATDKAAGKTDAHTASLGGMSKAASLASKALGAGVLLGAVTALGSKITELAEESTKAQAVFGNLSVEIDSARDATLGLVSDMELATAANEAVRLGVVESGDKFGELAGIATKLGLSVGRDATDALNSLNTALARQSPLMLDNLGIQLTLGEANAVYAKSLGKTASELTESERAVAFKTVALDRAREAAEGVTIAEDDLALAAQRAGVSLENFKTAAFGASDAQGKLAEAVRGLNGEIFTLDIERYGADLDKVDAALAKLGVTIEDVGGKQKILNEISRQAVALADKQAKQAKESEEALNARLLAQRTEEHKKINAEQDHQLAVQEALGSGESFILELKEEQLKTQIQQQRELAAVGQETKEQTAELERQLELTQIRLRVSQTTPRRRGSGRRRTGTEFDRILEEINKGRRFEEGDKQRDALVAVFEEEQAQRAEFIARGQQELLADLETRATLSDRRLELMEAEGEATALLRAAAQEQRAEELLQLGEVELAREASHNAAVLRTQERVRLIKEEQAAHKQQVKDLAAGSKIASQALGRSAFAALEASEMKGEAFANELGDFAKAQSQKLALQALFHTFRGAALAATLNPLAGLEFIAAGKAAAGAAALGGVAAIAGGLGGAGGPGGGATAGPSPAGPQFAGGSEGRTAGDAPISPLEDELGQGRPAAGAAGGGLVLNVQGSLVDGEKLVRVLQDFERQNGRILA